MGYGKIRRVSCSDYVWYIDDFTNIIQEGLGYCLYSPDFLLQEKSWCLNLFKHKNEYGVWTRFRLERCLSGDRNPCTHTYKLCILDVEGEVYWTSPVLTEEFRNDSLGLMDKFSLRDQCGTHHELLECELLRNVCRIAPKGVLSLHLTIYPGRRSTSSRGKGDAVKNVRSMSSSGTTGVESQTDENLEDVDSPKAGRSKSWAGIRTEKAQSCTNLLINQYCSSDRNDTDSLKAERFKSDSGTASGTQSCSDSEEVNSDDTEESKSSPGTASVGTQTCEVNSDNTGRSKTSLDTATTGTQTCGVHSETVETQTCTDLLCKEDCSSNAGIEKLSQNFKDFLMYDQDFDTVLIVKGRKFRAHKTILKAQSPKFAASLEEEMEKTKNDVVHIDDCEPGAFFHFQHYLYTGKCEKINDNIVVDLHYIAHKYCVEELSAACVQFMIRNLTVESFCDFFTVGLRHNNLELIESVKTFFKSNMKEITVTKPDKWKDFFRDNFKVAFELQQEGLNNVLK